MTETTTEDVMPRELAEALDMLQQLRREVQAGRVLYSMIHSGNVPPGPRLQVAQLLLAAQDALDDAADALTRPPAPEPAPLVEQVTAVLAAAANDG